MKIKKEHTKNDQNLGKKMEKNKKMLKKFLDL